MIHEFHLYHYPEPAPGFLDSFLGGLYFIKGVPLFLQLAILVLYPLSLGLLLLSRQNSKIGHAQIQIKLSQLASLLAFSLSALLLFSPWDESFINLRHSLNLAQYNNFSFNISSASEGTVDFLVFAIIGLLGKLQLPLVELLFFQSWLGGILCIFLLKAITTALDIPGSKNWTLFLATLFPPLMLNASHGFATSLFAAAILGAIYFIFLTQRLRLGFIILALVPLIRWEGFWFMLLCYAWCFRDAKRLRIQYKTLLVMALTAALPTLLLTYYRCSFYHSWIPIPVIYKNSMGNLFYSILGLRNLFLDMISGFGFAFALLWILTFAFERSILSKTKVLLAPLLLLTLFTIPYYLSGGDWFPAAWGRYLLPMTLFLTVSTWKLISVLETQKKQLFTAILCFTLFVCALARTSSVIKLYELLFSHGSALLSLNLKSRTENPAYRPHYLSQLGLHLKKISRPNDKIGSSELATLMYFSERDAVDFLGLTDLALARNPSRDTPLFVRKNPKSAELPLLIFKRLAPERLRTNLPAYLYTFDFMIEILMDQKSIEGWSNHDYFHAIHRWEKKFKGLVDPLYGGIATIMQLGYLPIIVAYDNDFCALYFVHQNRFKEHQERLNSLGFKERIMIDQE